MRQKMFLHMLLLEDDLKVSKKLHSNALQLLWSSYAKIEAILSKMKNQAKKSLMLV